MKLKKLPKKSSPKKLQSLKWAVKHRHQNQECAIKLFELLTHYPKQIQQGDYGLFCQGLVSVTFSLWRAAFLADKSGDKDKALTTAIQFLETVIADNAITYAYDKQQREWTFSYYANNACYTLLHWSRLEPTLVPTWKFDKRTPKERWEYGQKLLTEAVGRFEQVLRSTPKPPVHRIVLKK